MTTPARGAIAGTPTRSRWRADLFGSGLVETSYGRPAVGVVPGIRLSSMSGGSAGTDGCLYARELRRIGVDYRLHYTVQSEGWSQPMIYSRCGSVARSMPATCRNIIRCSPQVGHRRSLLQRLEQTPRPPLDHHVDQASRLGRCVSVSGNRHKNEAVMITEFSTTPEFKRGWDAALLAARQWHEAQASKTLVQARRSRFPKNLEREAEIHRKSAELIVNLSPEDV